MSIKISDIDVVFISYDEDNADENWADLLSKVPWAKRSHGVKGSDEAHKAAAKLSNTERVITIDGDNVVKQEFFEQTFDFDHPKFKNKVVSWAAINEVNGLRYGNGGVKCWPVEYIMNMKTHENSENDTNEVDFCWEDSYVQMNNSFSITKPNASPRQAWRAGFREGVKMSLDRGNKVSLNEFNTRLWAGNIKRLMIWSNVGADVPNGLWCIYGARLGAYMTNLTDWDFVNVRDFEWLNNFWEKEIKCKFEKNPTSLCSRTGYEWNENELKEEIQSLGKELTSSLKIPFALFDSNQSKFFKQVYEVFPRTGNYMTEEEFNNIYKVNV